MPNLVDRIFTKAGDQAKTQAALRNIRLLVKQYASIKHQLPALDSLRKNASGIPDIPPDVQEQITFLKLISEKLSDELQNFLNSIEVSNETVVMDAVLFSALEQGVIRDEDLEDLPDLSEGKHVSKDILDSQVLHAFEATLPIADFSRNLLNNSDNIQSTEDNKAEIPPRVLDEKIAKGELKRTPIDLLEGTRQFFRAAAEREGMSLTEFLRRAAWAAENDPSLLKSEAAEAAEQLYRSGLGTSRWNADKE